MMLGAAGVAASLHAAAQVTFYENEGFRGRMFTANGPMANFERTGGNDRASSVVVDRGSWDVCVDARYQGRCVTLRPGSYDSLSRMGLNDAISSVRPHDGKVRYDYTPEPLAAPTYEYRRRPNERLYEAPVTSVRAVVGPPNQRCWVEREQVRESPNVGGAVVGAILGGVLGHQIGSGRGNDVATVGGALAGRSRGLPGRTWHDRPRRPALRERLEHQSRLLGCDLQLPQPGAPCADEHASRPDGHGERARRAARLIGEPSAPRPVS
jgi:hypothetical protein